MTITVRNRSSREHVIRLTRVAEGADVVPVWAPDPIPAGETVEEVDLQAGTYRFSTEVGRALHARGGWSTIQVH